MPFTQEQIDAYGAEQVTDTEETTEEQNVEDIKYADPNQPTYREELDLRQFLINDGWSNVPDELSPEQEDLAYKTLVMNNFQVNYRDAKDSNMSRAESIKYARQKTLHSLPESYRILDLQKPITGVNQIYDPSEIIEYAANKGIPYSELQNMDMGDLYNMFGADYSDSRTAEIVSPMTVGTDKKGLVKNLKERQSQYLNPMGSTTFGDFLTNVGSVTEDGVENNMAKIQTYAEYFKTDPLDFIRHPELMTLADEKIKNNPEHFQTWNNQKLAEAEEAELPEASWNPLTSMWASRFGLESMAGATLSGIIDVIAQQTNWDWGKKWSDELDQWSKKRGDMQQKEHMDYYTGTTFADIWKQDNKFKAFFDTLGKGVEAAASSSATVVPALAGGVLAAASSPIIATAGLLTLGGTTLLGVGDVRTELIDKGVDPSKEALMNLGAGIVSGLTDALAGKFGIKGITPDLIEKMLSKEMIKFVTTRAIMEGTQEDIQELINIGNAAKQGVEYESPEIIDRMIGAGLAGAFTSGGMSTLQAMGTKKATAGQYVHVSREGAKKLEREEFERRKNALDAMRRGTQTSDLTSHEISESVSVEHDGDRWHGTSVNGDYVSGNTEEDVRKQLNQLANAEKQTIDSDSVEILQPIEGEESKGSSARVTLDNGVTITFTTPNDEKEAKGHLEKLIDIHNDNGNPIVFRENLNFVKKGKKNYQIVDDSGEVLGRGISIVQTYNDYKDNTIKEGDVGFFDEVEALEDLKHDIRGFDNINKDNVDAFAKSLQDAGYFIMEGTKKTPKGKVGNLVGKKSIRVVKDGYIHTIRLRDGKSNKSLSYTVDTKPLLPSEIVVPKEQRTGEGTLQDVDGNPVENSIKFNSPRGGVTVSVRDIAGEGMENIDYSKIASIATKIGGKIIRVNGKQQVKDNVPTDGIRSATMQLENGKIYTFLVTPGDQTLHVMHDGKTRLFRDGFNIYDVSGEDRTARWKGAKVASMNGSQVQTLDADNDGMVGFQRYNTKLRPYLFYVDKQGNRHNITTPTLLEMKDSEIDNFVKSLDTDAILKYMSDGNNIEDLTPFATKKVQVEDNTEIVELSPVVKFTAKVLGTSDNNLQQEMNEANENIDMDEFEASPLSLSDYLLTKTKSFQKWFGDSDVGVKLFYVPRKQVMKGFENMNSDRIMVTSEKMNADDVPFFFNGDLGYSLSFNEFEAMSKEDLDLASISIIRGGAPGGVTTYSFIGTEHLLPSTDISNIAPQVYDSEIVTDESSVDVPDSSIADNTKELNPTDPLASVPNPKNDMNRGTPPPKPKPEYTAHSVQQKMMNSLGKVLGDLQFTGDYEITGQGEVTIHDTNGDIVIDGLRRGTPEEIKSAIDNVLFKSAIYSNSEIENLEKGSYNEKIQEMIKNFNLNTTDYTVEDLEYFISVFPKRIRDMIEFHTDANSDRKNMFLQEGVTGVFYPISSMGKRIHIDATGGKDRTLGDVLNTVCHEVNHFGESVWNIKGLDTLYNKAWKVFKPMVDGKIPHYYDVYGIDPDNMTPQQKRLMINEILAVYNMNLFNIDPDNKDLPMSKSDIEAFKKISDNATIRITKELSENFTDLIDQTDVRQNQIEGFVKMFITANTATTMGKNLEIEFDIPYDADPNITAKMIVHSNGEYATGRTTLLETEEAKLVNKFKTFIAGGKNEFQRNIRRFCLRHYIPIYWGGGSFLGLGLNPMMCQSPIGNMRSLIDQACHNIDVPYAHELRYWSNLMTEMRAYMQKENIDTVDPSIGYKRSLELAGITDEKYLERADAIDSIMKNGYQIIHYNVARIREELMRHMDMLRKHTPEGSDAYSELNMRLAKINRFAERFVSNWEHRRYQANTKEGKKDLEWMYDFVVTGTELAGDQKDKAAADIEALNESLSRGEISERDHRIAIAEPQRIHRNCIRLEKLHAWASKEVADNPSRINDNESFDSTVSTVMREMLERYMGKRKPSKSSDDLSMAQQNLAAISAVKERVLSDKNPHDKNLIDFLAPIDDPYEAMLYSINEQAKVISALTFQTELVDMSINSGIGKIRGTGGAFSGSGDRIFQRIGEGGILEFLDIDPQFADMFKRQMEFNDAMMADDFVTTLIRTIKRNFTVKNPKTCMQNYISHTSSMVFMGTAFKKAHWADGKSIVFREFMDRVSNPKSLNEYQEMIRGDMIKGRILGTSYSSMEAHIAEKRDLFDKMINKSIDAIATIGVINNATGEGIKNGVNSFSRKIQEVYGYGDEWPKVFTYLNHYEMEIARAKTKVDRNMFSLTEFGDQEYENALRELAVPRAIAKTQGETTDWGNVPDYVRLTAGAKRLFVGDFIMHNFQVVNMMSGYWRNLKDSQAELRDIEGNNSEEANAYRELLRSEIFWKKVGGTAFGAVNIAYVTTAYCAIAAILNILGSVFSGGDDDDDKRKILEDNESVNLIRDPNAAIKVMNSIGYHGVSLMQPVLVQQGKELLTMSMQSTSALSAMTSTHQQDNSGVMGMFMQAANNILALNGEESTTIYQQLRNLLSTNPRDQYGRKLTHEQAMGSAASMILPGYLKFGASVVSGRNINAGFTKKPRWATLAGAATGMRIEMYNMEDAITANGYNAKEATSRTGNMIYKDVYNDLKSGVEMDDKKVKSIVDKLMSVSQDVVDNAKEGIEGYRGMGFTDAEIIQALKFNHKAGKNTGLADGIAKAMVSGDTKQIDINTIAKVKGWLDEILKKRVDDKGMSLKEQRIAAENAQKIVKRYIEAIK